MLGCELFVSFLPTFTIFVSQFRVRIKWTNWINMCTHRRGVAWKINWRQHTTSGVSFTFISLFFFFFFDSSPSSPTFTCISRFFSCWYNARNSSKIYIVFSLSPSKRSNFQFLIHLAGLLSTLSTYVFQLSNFPLPQLNLLLYLTRLHWFSTQKPRNFLR